MCTNQILRKIKFLLGWEKIKEGAKAKTDAFRDEIKQVAGRRLIIA